MRVHCCQNRAFMWLHRSPTKFSTKTLCGEGSGIRFPDVANGGRRGELFGNRNTVDDTVPPRVYGRDEEMTKILARDLGFAAIACSCLGPGEGTTVQMSGCHPQLFRSGRSVSLDNRLPDIIERQLRDSLVLVALDNVHRIDRAELCNISSLVDFLAKAVAAARSTCSRRSTVTSSTCTADEKATTYEREAIGACQAFILQATDQGHGTEDLAMPEQNRAQAVAVLTRWFAELLRRQ